MSRFGPGCVDTTLYDQIDKQVNQCMYNSTLMHPARVLYRTRRANWVPGVGHSAAWAPTLRRCLEVPDTGTGTSIRPHSSQVFTSWCGCRNVHRYFDPPQHIQRGPEGYTRQTACRCPRWVSDVLCCLRDLFLYAGGVELPIGSNL